MAYWRLIPILSAALLMASCSKESELASELKTGQQIGQSTFHILAAWTPAEEFAFSRWSQFASKQIRIEPLDTLYTDGDGVVYVMDFGLGTICADGIKRTGKCTVEISQSFFPAAGVLTWQSDTKDSFAFLSQTERITLSGKMMLSVDSSGQFLLNFNVLHSATGESMLLATNSKPVQVFYEQPIQNTRNSTTWNGDWTCTLQSTNTTSVIAKKLQNQGSCFSLWNSGQLTVTDDKEQDYQLNLDPFSTAACDLEFTVTQGKGLNSKEMVFKAW
jgi:hypothetical protein